MNRKEIEQLERFATEIRLETLKEIKNLGFGHIGGSMSVVELLAVLYGKVMNIDPKNPKWENRDYLVVSKGHSGPAVYAALALKGYFPIEDLMTLNVDGTKLPSHCDKNLTPGIDMTTGSLAQGTSTSIGIALGNKLDNRDSYTYLVVGDGELNEGQCWEAVMFAAHHKVDNLICFVDNNKKQLDDYVENINKPFIFEEKFAAFGWDACTVKGDDVEAIDNAISKAKTVKGKPSVIVLDTIKGQGVPFVENTFANHSIKFGEVQHREADITIRALEEKLGKSKVGV